MPNETPLPKLPVLAAMIPLFTAAIFGSALLLFWVQPMVAKMLLPLLGGTPMVWNTCMVFFQAVLLAGYAYAHFLTTRCSARAQAGVHGLVLTLALIAMPIGLPANQAPPWDSDPTVWLLSSLLTMVGLPFFALAASSPLLQSWFSRTRHPSAGDPYFLYAASNAGSLLGLLAYPLLVEPGLSLRWQTWAWAGLYFVLAGLLGGCGLVGVKSPAPLLASQNIRAEIAPTWFRRGQWVLWAFIPSSLMLAVTSYLTTDIASVPLLWVVPLGLYLVTLTVAFTPRISVPSTVLTRVLPIAAVALTFLQLTEIRNPAWVLVCLHLGFFFVVALFFHARLAADRPPGRFLTEFYFCLSIGGVLGGAFNSLAAPLLFRTILEYPLVLVLACLAWRPHRPPSPADVAPVIPLFRRSWRLAWPALHHRPAGLAAGNCHPRLGLGASSARNRSLWRSAAPLLSDLGSCAPLRPIPGCRLASELFLYCRSRPHPPCRTEFLWCPESDTRSGSAFPSSLSRHDFARPAIHRP